METGEAILIPKTGTARMRPKKAQRNQPVYRARRAGQGHTTRRRTPRRGLVRPPGKRIKFTAA